MVVYMAERGHPGNGQGRQPVLLYGRRDYDRLLDAENQQQQRHPDRQDLLQNYVYSGYVLPSTGGMGTVPFAAVGGMLTVGAALLLAKRKKHEEKGE